MMFAILVSNVFLAILFCYKSLGNHMMNIYIQRMVSQSEILPLMLRFYD